MSEQKDINYKYIALKIENFFENNNSFLIQGFSINDLSSHINVNYKYVSATIKEVYHSNFRTLINKYRISKACEYLDNPQLKKVSAQELTEMVGFKSRSAFYNAFKNETGHTPYGYKKNRKQDFITKKVTIDLMGNDGIGSDEIICCPIVLKSISSFKKYNDYDFKDLQILICDDLTVNLKLPQYFLENEDAIVDICSNAKKAIELVQNKKYDLIIMDIDMPSINGIEASKEIRQIDEEVKIILLSGKEMYYNDLKKHTAIIDAFLPKPFNLEKLREICNQLD